MRKRIGLLALNAAALFALLFGLHALNLTINTTPSMPIGLWRVSPLGSAGVHTGDVVAACLPHQIAALGRERGYLSAGSCPSGTVPILKIVVAIGGAVVDLDDRGITVGGHRFAAPTAHVDRKARVMQHIARGTYRLSGAQMWVWSPYPGSWDSRYFGPLPTSSAIGRAQLLIAFVPWHFDVPRFVFSPIGKARASRRSVACGCVTNRIAAVSRVARDRAPWRQPGDVPGVSHPE